jgi:hypothetical protein
MPQSTMLYYTDRIEGKLTLKCPVTDCCTAFPSRTPPSSTCIQSVQFDTMSNPFSRFFIFSIHWEGRGFPSSFPPKLQDYCTHQSSVFQVGCPYRKRYGLHGCKVLVWRKRQLTHLSPLPPNICKPQDPHSTPFKQATGPSWHPLTYASHRTLIAPPNICKPQVPHSDVVWQQASNECGQPTCMALKLCTIIVVLMEIN